MMRRIPAALFLVAGIAFLLPFASVSCSEEMREQAQGPDVSAEVSGLDLALGTSPIDVDAEPREFAIPRSPSGSLEAGPHPEPWAIVGLAMAVLGLLATTLRLRDRIAHTLGAAAGLVGTGSLLLLRRSLGTELPATGDFILDLGFGPGESFTIGARYGFWLALGASAAAAAVALVGLLRAAVSASR